MSQLSINIETLSEPWIQQIKYEWRPKLCNECIKLVHDAGDVGRNKNPMREF